jgi:hypothetical protein
MIYRSWDLLPDMYTDDFLLIIFPYCCFFPAPVLDYLENALRKYATQGPFFLGHYSLVSTLGVFSVFLGTILDMSMF